MGSVTMATKKAAKKLGRAAAGTKNSPWKNNGGARRGAGRKPVPARERRVRAMAALRHASEISQKAFGFLNSRSARASNAKLLDKIAQAKGYLGYARKMIAGK